MVTGPRSLPPDPPQLFLGKFGRPPSRLPNPPPWPPLKRFPLPCLKSPIYLYISYYDIEYALFLFKKQKHFAVVMSGSLNRKHGSNSRILIKAYVNYELYSSNTLNGLRYRSLNRTKERTRSTIQLPKHLLDLPLNSQ